jgi:hypothetical protein
MWESKWIDDPDRAREHLSKCLAALDMLSERTSAATAERG